MDSRKGTITLAGVRDRKESDKRLIAEGRYLLTGNPRRGGIASVYRAYDSINEKNVAIKLFRAAHGRDDIVEESFRRETQALSDLRHPNIVEILDSGIEEATGEHFIAMEWVAQDLGVFCSKSPFQNWKDFYNALGRQILEAIAFAHTHAIVHRDIKPSNILITEEGIAKVCDFGISKIRNFLEPGVTLAQYASIPYAPPEPDNGSYSYSRDVFGFAALCVSLLSPTPPKDHQELVRALEAVTVDEQIKRILRRSLSLQNPGERPTTAAVLLGELDRLAPRPKLAKAGIILLSITKKVRDVLTLDLGIDDEIEAQKFIVQDLSDLRVIPEPPRQLPDGPKPLGPSIKMFGNRYGYIGVWIEPAKLKLVSALEYSTSQIEENREYAYEPPFAFGLSGSTLTGSEGNIKKLQESLVEFSADQKAAIVDRRRQAIYNTWLNLLNAKTDLEQSRRRKTGYSKWEMSGSAIRFFVPDGVDTAVFDEQDVLVEVSSKLDFVGTVVSVHDDSVSVVPNNRNKVEADSLPASGVLTIDTTKADAALDKQKSALDVVRYGRSVNPSLGSFIVSPADVPEGHPATIQFIEESLDDDKKEAVQVAMSNPDLLLIQGPPGTGKTTFITELVLQALRRDPESRILLTSQTHVALDNSLERISAQSSVIVQAVRIGHPDDDRISPKAKTLLVDNKLPILRRTALAQGRQFLEKWANDHNVEMKYAKMAMALESLARLKERFEYVESRIVELTPILTEDKRNQLEADERADLDQELNDRIKERDSLHKDVKESFAEVRKYESDSETLEHLLTCPVTDLRDRANSYSPNTPAAAQLRKLLAAYADWESRFGRSREFTAALIASSQVVAGTCLGVMSIPGRQEIEYDLCIVDEASIATPTEVLVPMSRARRTILVGDSKQLSPFQDPELQSKGLLAKYNLSPQDQKETLFNHLAEHLPESLKKSLTTQHRMLPAIGNLISECFYDGSLKSVERTPKGYLSGVMRHPVVWFSTSRFSNRGSRRVGKSCINDLEVEQVISFLSRANFALTKGKDKGRQISVAVLTGYSPQKDRLGSAIKTRQRDWEGLSNIYVNVVDAFQGREADIVVFSVTRSDERGLGFLKEMERINVALSRGKEYLAIIGDHMFCQDAESQRNPLKNVLDYIRRNNDTCSLEEVTP